VRAESLSPLDWNGFMFAMDNQEELTFFNIKNTFMRALNIFRNLYTNDKEELLKKIMRQSPKWSKSLDMYWEVYQNAEKRKKLLAPNFGVHTSAHKFFTENVAKNPSFENKDPSQEWLAYVSVKYLF
jgi:hypothetical protein